MTSVKTPRFVLASLSLVAATMGLALDREAPIWGVYADYHGPTERWSNACDITYVVGWESDRSITKKVLAGEMIPIRRLQTWRQATAIANRHRRFHDDEPDGRVKIMSCEAFKSSGLRDQRMARTRNHDSEDRDSVLDSEYCRNPRFARRNDPGVAHMDRVMHHMICNERRRRR